MSCALVYRPVQTEKSVGDSALREALREEFGDFPFRLTRNDLAFARGLRAAKVDGADDLIQLIERYGELEMDIRC